MSTEKVDACLKLFETMTMRELILAHSYLGEQMAYREAARTIPVAKVMG